VDDAVQLIAHLGCDKVNILAGSWGATVAMLLAVQQPQLIDRMVLRAPFIPFTSRIDNFFEHLESVAPKWFASVFGKNARTFEVCSQMLDNHDLDEQFNKAYCWSSLEEVALGVRSANSLPSSENIQVQFSKDHANRLLRKYLLQSHFFVSSCFWAEGDWFKNMKELNKSNIRVSIAQGLDDKVCPLDGALIIKEQFTKVELTFLESCGHLANSPNMISALVNFISR
jgi:proline iminopeptidase